MIYSIDEYRKNNEAHLVSGKTIEEIYAKVAERMNKDVRYNILHIRKYNYTGNIKTELSRKSHSVRRVQAQQI